MSSQRPHPLIGLTTYGRSVDNRYSLPADYLDRYAAVLPERTEVARLVRELRAVREAHRRLVAEEREAARLQDMLRHELAEIEGASLREAVSQKNPPLDRKKSAG